MIAVSEQLTVNGAFNNLLMRVMVWDKFDMLLTREPTLGETNNASTFPLTTSVVARL